MTSPATFDGFSLATLAVRARAQAQADRLGLDLFETSCAISAEAAPRFLAAARQATREAAALAHLLTRLEPRAAELHAMLSPAEPAAGPEEDAPRPDRTADPASDPALRDRALFPLPAALKAERADLIARGVWCGPGAAS